MIALPSTRALPLLLLLALAGSAHGGSASVETLLVDGIAADVRFADVDGDSKKDAVIVCTHAGGASSRQVRVYRNLGGRFAAEPSAVLVVPRDAVLADLADVDGNGGQDLLLADADGLLAACFVDGAFAPFQRFAAVPSFFRPAASVALPFAQLAKDLDLDGIVDLLVPGRDGFVFLRGAGAGKFSAPFALAASVLHDVAPAENAFFRLTASLAHPTAADWDGDGQGDLLLAFEERLMRITLGAGGAPGPATLLIDFSRLLDAGKSGADGLVLSSGMLRDVDGDGRCDLVLTQRTARPTLLAGIATRTLLFLSSDLAAPAPQKPRQVIKIDGVSGKPQLVDLDRDGALDLMLTQVETDPLAKLKETVLEIVKVSFQVYRFDPSEHRFSSEPVFAESLAVKADRLLEVGAGGDLGLDSDHDGDGRPDFARYDARGTTLTVRKGFEKSGFFSDTPVAFEDEPFVTVKVDLPGPFRGEDVDGDRVAEIVACGPGRVVIVRFSP